MRFSAMPSAVAVEVVDLELDDVALGPAELSHRDEAAVAADDAAGRPGRRAARPGRTAEAALDRVEVLVAVEASVRWVEVEGRERDAADGEAGRVRRVRHGRLLPGRLALGVRLEVAYAAAGGRLELCEPQQL